MKNTLPLYWFLINIVFLLKYSPTAPIYSVPIAVALSFGILIWDRQISKPKFRNVYHPVLWLFIGLAVLLHLGLLVFIDKLDVSVDRWSALEYFWATAFQGDFPYASTTHIPNGNTPSPLPIWQLFTLPFTLLGDVGILQVAVFLSVCVILYRRHRFLLFKYLPWVILSPLYWYEALTRSDLISCMIIGIIAMLHLKKLDKNHLIYSSIILGLVMSTRSVLVIPLSILMIHLFSSAVRKGFIVFAVSLMIFTLTFTPFALWDWTQFIQYNPLILNGNKSGSLVIALGLALAIVLGFIVRKQSQIFCASGLLVLFITLIPFIQVLFENGLMVTLLENKTDIVYLGMGLPFMLFAQASSESY